MIKILHVGFSENPGGVENIVMNYYREIDKTQFQFDFLDLYGSGIAFQEEITALGGKILPLPNYKRHPVTAARKLSAYLEQEHYDIVHVHMQSAANIMPILAARRHGVKAVIAHSHSSSLPSGMLRKLFNYTNLNRLRNMPIEKWACGMKAGKWMWGDSFREYDIVANAIDYEQYRFHPEIRAQRREACGLSEADRVIGFVGRFGEEKNTFFLLEILQQLRTYSKDYKLLTVGGNDLYEEFYAKMKAMQLEDAYYSAGIQKSARDWYQAMDAFLLPSFFEGFPMVGVEAQAAGLPCYLSDRISPEINLSGSIRFLPIGEGCAKQWADAIHENFGRQSRTEISITDGYKIRQATRQLEKKYRCLV